MSTQLHQAEQPYGLQPIYGISASAYLRRARDRLLDGTSEALFYTAHELRCCVEARQAEYLEHLRPYRGKKVRPYRLGENRDRITKIMRGEVIVRMTMGLPGGRTVVGYHTPVPKRLVEYCERRLDNLRHAQAEYRPPSDPWWPATRAALMDAYRTAWVACRGNLIVPPLWTRAGEEVHPVVFEFGEDEREEMDAIRAATGVRFNINIEYLDQPPSEWTCDL